MWHVLLLADQSPSPNLGDAVIYYGIASPFLGYLLWDARRKDKRIEELDKRHDDQQERLLAQTALTIPLLADCTHALERAADQLSRDRAHDGQRERGARSGDDGR